MVRMDKDNGFGRCSLVDDEDGRYRLLWTVRTVRIGTRGW